MPPPSALIEGGGTDSRAPLKRRIVVWENGAPVVRDCPTMPAETVEDIRAAVLARPYCDENDEMAIAMGLEPSRFYGLTLAEVMLIRQAENAARSGEKDEVEAIMDRHLGKPKTSSENHNISETYEGALKRIAKADEASRLRVARDVTPRTEDPSGDL